MQEIKLAAGEELRVIVTGPKTEVADVAACKHRVAPAPDDARARLEGELDAANQHVKILDAQLAAAQEAKP